MIPALKNLNFFSIHSARFSTHKKNDNCLSKCVHDNKKKCVNFWENFHSEFRCANFFFCDFLMMWSMMRKAKNKKKKCIDGVFAICHNQTKPLIIPQNRILWQDWNFDYFFFQSSNCQTFQYWATISKSIMDLKTHLNLSFLWLTKDMKKDETKHDCAIRKLPKSIITPCSLLCENYFCIVVI